MGIIKGVNIIADGTVIPPDPSANRMKFSINFNSPPSGATLTCPKQKYNKLSNLALQWDDGSVGSLIGRDYFKTVFYTDGCGNNVSYTGDLALNCGTGVPSDLGYNPDYMQQPALRQLIIDGFDLVNHGMFHGSDGNADPTVDTNQLNNLILLRVAYQIRGTAIPTNYNGYAHAAFVLDYVYAASQGDSTFDEFRPTRVYKVYPPLSTVPGFMAIVRDFNDEWDNPSSFTFLNGEVASLLNGQRDYFIVGTHSGFETTDKLNGWKSWITTTHNTINDKVLVTSLREALEYREMCKQPITKVVNGNSLEVTVDLGNLSSKNRWRDMSFIIGNTTATMTGITIEEGITRTSYNATSKLVNIFNQKQTW